MLIPNIFAWFPFIYINTGKREREGGEREEG
jgi:hypothetical protein